MKTSVHEEIVAAYRDGRETVAQIAKRLRVSVSTVCNHGGSRPAAVPSAISASRRLRLRDASGCGRHPARLPPGGALTRALALVTSDRPRDQRRAGDAPTKRPRRCTMPLLRGVAHNAASLFKPPGLANAWRRHKTRSIGGIEAAVRQERERILRGFRALSRWSSSDRELVVNAQEVKKLIEAKDE